MASARYREMVKSLPGAPHAHKTWEGVRDTRTGAHRTPEQKARQSRLMKARWKQARKNGT